MSEELKSILEELKQVQAERVANWVFPTAYPKDEHLETIHLAHIAELKSKIGDIENRKLKSGK